MNPPLQPTSLAELADAVRSAPQVIPIGAGTKVGVGLDATGKAVAISTSRLTGILDYAPTEFTFTALAGTPIQEIIQVLAREGQYMPFDPPLAAAGATIGGTVAAGLNGPGRLRFGGIRDFILGVRFMDGDGRLLRMGGKVVKNAAGFDLPKFFVGSRGQFGVLCEITFKVFPKPRATLTLEFKVGDDAAMAGFFAAVARGRWEFDALDGSPAEGKVYARLAGPPDALQQLAADLNSRWPATILSAAEENSLWQSTGEFSWTHAGGVLCKVPLTLASLPKFAAFRHVVRDARIWISAAGNVGFVSLPDAAAMPDFGELLHRLGLEGLVVRGAPLRHIGASTNFKIFSGVKAALDPLHRFPSLN